MGTLTIHALDPEVERRIRMKGKSLPINDVWLAAQCMETGSILVSYDEHFAATIKSGPPILWKTRASILTERQATLSVLDKDGIV